MTDDSTNERASERARRRRRRKKKRGRGEFSVICLSAKAARRRPHYSRRAVITHNAVHNYLYQVSEGVWPSPRGTARTERPRLTLKRSN